MFYKSENLWKNSNFENDKIYASNAGVFVRHEGRYPHGDALAYQVIIPDSRELGGKLRCRTTTYKNALSLCQSRVVNHWSIIALDQHGTTCWSEEWWNA